MADSAYPRNVRGTLKLALADTPVVALLGARQSGKSTLARALAPGRAYVTLDEEPMLRTAREDPVGFIAALSPLFERRERRGEQDLGFLGDRVVSRIGRGGRRPGAA